MKIQEDLILKKEQLPTPDLQLFNFIKKESSVCFFRPMRFKSFSYLTAENANYVCVVDQNNQMGSYVLKTGCEFVKGDIEELIALKDIRNLIEIQKNQNIQDYTKKDSQKIFDLLIFDESMLEYGNVLNLIENIKPLATNILFTIPNKATLEDRIRFFVTGRMYSKKDTRQWYNQDNKKICTSQEFIEFCVKAKLEIQRACFYKNDGEISSIYDSIRMPSLFAKKFFFIVRTPKN